VLRAYDTVVDPGGFVRAWLAEHGRMFEDRVYAGESYIRVQGYLTDNHPCFEVPTLTDPLDVTFGGRLQLLGRSARGDSVVAGHDWSVDLYWRARRASAEDDRIVMEMVDAHRQPWARVDEMPLGNAYPTSRWQAGEVLRQPIRMHVPAGVAGGLYTVQIMVYDPAKQAALGVVDANGRALEGAVKIADLTVR
jgi:hypothetical protein